MKTYRSICAAVLTLTLPAFAGTTTVLSPPSNEFNHEQILEAVYGGDFTPTGLDFVGGGAGGGVSAIRFDDFLMPNGILDAVTGALGSAADQFWADGFIAVEARARFAGFTQQFGFDRGNGFEPLFNVSGSGTSVTGSGAADLTGETWHWIRRNEDGSNVWHSVESLNSDGLDHMVTYRIAGLDTPATTWLLLWEDVGGGTSGTTRHTSDRDFNDLVVEVRAIPEPATLAFAVVGGWLAWRGRRRIA